MMHFYYFKAAKNYKDIFQLICAAKIKNFNSYLYFYCINNRINPLIFIVDLNKVSPIIKEEQSYIKLFKELWDRTE